MKATIRMYTPEDHDQLIAFYEKSDQHFFPPLSHREGGIQQHIQQTLENGGSYCILEEKGNIRGAVGFHPIDDNRETVRFTFFSVDNPDQNPIIPFRMAHYLAVNRNELGYANTKKVECRTATQKSAERLQKIGLTKTQTVKGELIPDRTSMYFEGALDQILQKHHRN